jgi:hypothetical protein
MEGHFSKPTLSSVALLWKSSKGTAMHLDIELPDALGAAVKAQAQAEGVSADRFVSRVLENTLAPVLTPTQSNKPFETGYGMLAKYGPAPSAEEIDENRRDMFRNFAQEF